MWAQIKRYQSKQHVCKRHTHTHTHTHTHSDGDTKTYTPEHRPRYSPTEQASILHGAHTPELLRYVIVRTRTRSGTWHYWRCWNREDMQTPTSSVCTYILERFRTRLIACKRHQTTSDSTVLCYICSVSTVRCVTEWLPTLNTLHVPNAPKPVISTFTTRIILTINPQPPQLEERILHYTMTNSFRPPDTYIEY